MFKEIAQQAASAIVGKDTTEDKLKMRAAQWWFSFLMESNHSKPYGDKEMKAKAKEVYEVLQIRMKSHHKMLDLGYVWMPDNCLYIKPTPGKPTVVQVSGFKPQVGNDKDGLHSFMVHDTWMTPAFVSEVNKLLPLAYKQKTHKVRGTSPKVSDTTKPQGTDVYTK